MFNLDDPDSFQYYWHCLKQKEQYYYAWLAVGIGGRSCLIFIRVDIITKIIYNSWKQNFSHTNPIMGEKTGSTNITDILFLPLKGLKNGLMTIMFKPCPDQPKV